MSVIPTPNFLQQTSRKKSVWHATERSVLCRKSSLWLLDDVRVNNSRCDAIKQSINQSMRECLSIEFIPLLVIKISTVVFLLICKALNLIQVNCTRLPGTYKTEINKTFKFKRHFEF